MTTLPMGGLAMTAAEVAEAVAEELGCSPDEAASMVSSYIDETSERVGVSVKDWTLDDADVEAITSSIPSTTATAAAVAEATAAVDVAAAAEPDVSSTAAADTVDADSDAHVEVEAG